MCAEPPAGLRPHSRFSPGKWTASPAVWVSPAAARAPSGALSPVRAATGWREPHAPVAALHVSLVYLSESMHRPSGICRATKPTASSEGGSAEPDLLQETSGGGVRAKTGSEMYIRLCFNRRAANHNLDTALCVCTHTRVDSDLRNKDSGNDLLIHSSHLGVCVCACTCVLELHTFKLSCSDLLRK